MIHKTTRSILSVLLAALLLVTSVPLTPAFAGGGGVSLQSESGEGPFAGGTGTKDNPYQIATAEELWDFAELVNNKGETTANAILTADIDLNPDMKIDEDGKVTNGDDLAQWTPIGNSISGDPYEGTFNGAGHTISGLYIDSSANDQGLFGYVSGSGKVQNLSVSGDINGNNHVGGVVGLNLGSVENCHNTGTVTGTVDSVGGVVGDNRGSVINCYNTGEVSGNSYVGGVVGYNIGGGRVTNSYNTGAVSGLDSVSGSYVGGVVGHNSGSIVENCYNTGEVSGPDRGNSNYVGGVVGYNDGSGTVTDCYFLKDTAEKGIGSDSSAAGAAVVDNLSDLCDKFKDDTTWSISGILGRPVLQENPEGGLGTDKSPYEISTADQLETFRDLVKNGIEKSAHAKLMNNIDLSSVCGKNAGESGQPVSWAPIGSDSNEYTGTFNGDGHTISGLYIDSSDVDYKGLFGRVNGGTVQDLSVSGNVSGDRYVGGVVGFNNGGTVTGCIFSGSGSVSGDWHVGGVVGYNNGGTVTGCIFSGSGSVSGNRYVGGVVGYNSSGTVTNCAFSGTVTGIYVGGVVGENSGSNGSVEKCHNTGSVNGSVNSVGGVVGYNAVPPLGASSVTNCYNIGDVSGKISVGGVVGLNDSGIVENCYNTGTVTGTDDYVGGVVGWNSGTVTNCYNTDSVSGLDSVSGNSVGGVVGYNSSGTVENCHNTGKVTGSSDYSYIGGVVGNNSGTVKNCYNIGSVTATGIDGRVGGVVGYNDSSASVANCYNTGSVSGSGSYVGGVVGYNDYASVTNCYFLKTADVNKNLSGIGFGGEGQEAIQKTADEFRSGEVAYLLQGTQTTPVWGQSALGTEDSLPTLVALDKDENAKPVYKVVFISDNTEIEAQYANSGMTVDLPATEPTKEGYTFAGWFTESSGGSQWNFSTAVTENMTLYAQWTAVEEPIPTPDPTPTPDPEPSGPSTGDSTGWDDIRDELENAAKGDEITIDMGDETKVPAEVFETLAGQDITLEIALEGGVTWTVNGQDIPADANLDDLDLGVEMNSDGIPVDVVNAITGEHGSVQLELAHNGAFGFTMTLTAPLGEENAGYWANLYYFDEDAEQLNFEAAAEIDEDGNVKIPFTHASQYAIVIDTHSHATVDVSDLFIDIAPDAWYKDAIQYAYDNGLMTGVSATEFAPEATTTRAMIVSILARLEGVTTAQAAGFADVDDNDWYATAVNWAANVGVVNGYEDNTFRPNTAITREQLAAILMNYAAYKGEDVSNRADLTTYTDQPSTWAEEAMSWAVAEGLISGVTNDQLQPQGNATRAQVAAILQRFLTK